jgi:hypothetical protein
MNEQRSPIRKQDVEEIWRRRLSEAKGRYEVAVARFQTASEEFRNHHTTPPDGGFGVHLAIAAESSARKEYMRVLRLYTDLLLHGKVPEDNARGHQVG